MEDERSTRIQARRDRVENRHVTHEDTTSAEAEGKEVARGAARIAESLASLDARKVGQLGLLCALCPLNVKVSGSFH
jgi:hypothetical protein